MRIVAPRPASTANHSSPRSTTVQGPACSGFGRGKPVPINTHEIGEGVVFDDGKVKVTAFVEDHRPVEPALGYRFESKGKVIVVSGDTRPNDNLLKFAKNADVLVMEAYLPEHFLKVDTPEVARKLMAYHTSAEEAGDVATEAGVKTLVLTHLIPANAEGTFAERAQAHFRGKVIVGRDLLRVEP